MKLERIVKKLAPVALAASMFGCTAVWRTHPIHIPNDDSRLAVQMQIKPVISNVGVSNYSVSEEIRTVPIHEEDGGPQRGKVVFDEPVNYCVDFGIGGDIGIGTDFFRVYGGLNLQLAGNNYEDEKRQRLPHPYESYGYYKYDSDSTGAVPYVGAEVTLAKRLSFAAEYGWLSEEINIEKGHYRWGGHTPIMKMTEKADGQLIRGIVFWRFDQRDSNNKYYLGASYTTEIFDSEQFNMDKNKACIFIGTEGFRFMDED